MTIFKQPEDAQHRVECTVAELDKLETALDAERKIAHAKGYLSALRYSQLIEHKDFKRLDQALDNSLIDWHKKHSKL